MTKTITKEKMQSFLPDEGQTARVIKQCSRIEKDLAAQGIKHKHTFSLYVRTAVEEKLKRDEKKR